MKIHDMKTIKEIQQEFNQVFPYLKLEFFRHSPALKMNGCVNEKLNPELTVGEIRQESRSGFMPIDGIIPVDIFEKKFEETFGLYVQVYRKSFDRWLPTWATDVWTLEEQNNRGRIMGEFEDLETV